MAVLDLTLGWSSGDDIRVLIAGGLSVSSYTVNQIRADMNGLGELSEDAVTSVLDLLDEYDIAQQNMKALNNDSSGKVLIKADVLEWKAIEAGSGYSPEREIGRIRALLNQYFSMSPLFGGFSMGSPLVRS